MSQQVEAGEAQELHSHPQPRQYVTIAVILAIVTAGEVAFFLTGVVLAITVFAVVLVYFFTHGGPAPVAT